MWRKNIQAVENFQEIRSHERVPDNTDIDFLVLSTQTDTFQRIKSSGTIIDTSRVGVGILTPFPLEPGHVLEWDDRHEKGKLHLAMVKWCRRQNNSYRAGLLLI